MAKKKVIEKPKLGICADCMFSTPKGSKSVYGEYFMCGCDHWNEEVKHPNYYFLDHECENGKFKKRCTNS